MTLINTDQLYRCEPPWIHVTPQPDLHRLPFRWPFEGDPPEFIVRRLRGRKMRTLDALFSEFAAALQFPEYFGENWPALDECLSDLEWLPGNVYGMIVTDADLVLVDEPMADFETLLKIFDRAGAEWSKPIALGEYRDRSPKPFHTVLLAKSEHLPSLRQRLLGTTIPLSEL